MKGSCVFLVQVVLVLTLQATLRFLPFVQFLPWIATENLKRGYSLKKLLSEEPNIIDSLETYAKPNIFQSTRMFWRILPKRFNWEPGISLRITFLHNNSKLAVVLLVPTRNHLIRFWYFTYRLVFMVCKKPLYSNPNLVILISLAFQKLG